MAPYLRREQFRAEQSNLAALATPVKVLMDVTEVAAEPESIAAYLRGVKPPGAWFGHAHRVTLAAGGGTASGPPHVRDVNEQGEREEPGPGGPDIARDSEPAGRVAVERGWPSLDLPQ